MTTKVSFIVLPTKMLVIGEQILCNVYVHLSDGKAVLIMKQGDVLHEEDVERFAKYPRDKLLITKEEYNEYISSQKDKFIESVVNGDGELSQESKKELVAHVFNVSDDDTAEEKVETIVGRSKELISGLLTNQSKFDFKQLLGVLKNMENDSDPYKIHASQVSSISMMIAQLVPAVQMEHINEIGLAAAIHSMGLQFLSNPSGFNLVHPLFETEGFELGMDVDQNFVNKVIDKHFKGHYSLDAKEEDVYIKHLAFLKDIPLNSKYKNLIGVKRTLDDFKKIQEKDSEAGVGFNPYLSAKILIIGDRLLGHLKASSEGTSMADIVLRMKAEHSNSDKRVVYDHKYLDLLQEVFSKDSGSLPKAA
ncbi:MAG: hypothetical protein H6621_07750 [Halobacteriovoraceae bacterium]|nr:hypothetical protein [Halobacteriovoraceae bacterium]